VEWDSIFDNRKELGLSAEAIENHPFQMAEPIAFDGMLCKLLKVNGEFAFSRSVESVAFDRRLVTSD
jgi:hypothetical protein